LYQAYKKNCECLCLKCFYNYDIYDIFFFLQYNADLNEFTAVLFEVSVCFLMQLIVLFSKDSTLTIINKSS